MDKGVTVELNVIKDNKPERKQTDIQRLILGWKILIGVPQDNKEWDRVFYKRLSRSAKEIISITGSIDNALDCMELVIDDCQAKNISYAFDTILKRIHLYLEKKG